ncbi:diguanylate cyclase [Acidovorax sp. GW101-3H11]|uniref:diguanylate cyclase n=1 Tax=Acidovorax sp. GW101-3H11 TaxID=1813946 RepID=UPI000A4BC688|nr:diguanylate cyclase [Acidovorax sp. GW101-3H11]
MYPLLCALLMLARHWHAHCGVAATLLCLVAPMALPLSAQAASPLVLSQERPQVDAWEAVTLKADPTYQLSVQDMLSQLRAFETPAQRGGSIGVHKAAMWLHIPIVAPEAPRTPWVVNIGYSSLQAELYLTSGGKVLQQVLKKHGNQTQLSSRTPAMALDLQPGQRYDLLIRVQATGPLILPITVSEMPVYLRQSLGEQLLQGLINGLALCLLAYSLIQWVTQRDRMFAFYALVVLGSAGFSMQFFGIGPQYLWPDNPWMDRYSGPAAGLMALVGSFLFLGHMLAEGTQKSRYARTMRAGAAITAAVCGALLFGWLSVPIAVAFMSLAGPLPSIISLPAAIARVRQKDPIGVTLLLAWIAFGVAAGVMVCLVQGWVPANFWTLHSFQFGATLDMLLFFRVLGLRAQATKAQAQEAMRERDLMHSLANTDPLTGLSNRRGLQHALQAALAHCSPQRLVALYLMDLDGFKPVNDSHGHDVGDDLLVAVGQRLQASVRQQTDLVARLGGDEFIIMACHLETPQQAEDLGRALLQSVDQPFCLGNLRLKVGLTIGYALAPLDSNDPQGLIRLADAAMYAGKQGGKRSIRRNTGELALAP